MTDPVNQATEASADELSTADINYLLNDSEGQEVLAQAVSDFLNEDDE
jgi:hypothetical protein